METQGTTMLPPLPLTWQERKERFEFLLGHPDAEMREIENILKKKKLPYRYATHQGHPVTPRTCYRADKVAVKGGRTLVLVECEPIDYFQASTLKLRVIDHHRPGDPGFGLPPEQYWEASSIGQVCQLLNVKKPGRRLQIVAARDHCRFAAQRGECVGITPKEVTVVGRQIIARELGVNLAFLQTKISKMLRALERSPTITMAKQDVVNFTKVAIGEIYSLGYLSVYEALADLGGAAVVRTRNSVHENDKFVLMGDLLGSTVRHFMDVWAPAQGLRDIYGCDVRGHAGGYIDSGMIAVAA